MKFSSFTNPLRLPSRRLLAHYRVGAQPAPKTQEEQQALIDTLQDDKTTRYKQLVESNAVCRPGVLELMDEALADPSIAVGVCSASTKSAAQRTLSVTLGQERVEKLDVCILGDDVSEKKPSPLIYNEAANRLGISKERCVVIEDSLIGLKAAKGAVSPSIPNQTTMRCLRPGLKANLFSPSVQHMKCVITYTDSTKNEDFYLFGADAKVPTLGSRGVTLASIFGPMREGGPDAQMLEGMKDPVAIATE